MYLDMDGLLENAKDLIVVAGGEGRVRVVGRSQCFLPTEQPGPIDVAKPYLQAELSPRAVHFLVPKPAGTTKTRKSA